MDTDIRSPITAPDPTTHRLFDMRLVPHRSLTPPGFRILMGIFALICTASSIPFVIAGAWPVAGFMGADIAIIYFAFRANYRAARAYEDVVVTPLELSLAKVTSRGDRREYRFHPSWVQIRREDHEEYGLQRIALTSRGRSVEVASFLGPDAKADFAAQLTLALNEARRGPRFS